MTLSFSLVRTSACGRQRTATVERNGKPFCTQHDPERQKARDAQAAFGVQGRVPVEALAVQEKEQRP